MFTVKGITDSVNTCDCCGRSGLKRTVALESDATGLVHYGVDCAGAAVLGKKSRRNASTVERAARGVAYASKWITVHGRTPEVLQKIADRVAVKYCSAYRVGDKLNVYGYLV